MTETVSALANVEDFRPKRRLHADTIKDFLERDIKPREMVLAPFLPEQGLVMIYSWRGVGKTHVALGIAYAVATGGTFLKWKAPKPRRVLYCDGEMPAASMQERLAAVAKASPDINPDNLRLITPDLQELGIMPNLSTPEGQRLVEEWIFDGDERLVDLLTINNISTFCHGGKENEADSWTAMQGWLLKLRRKGVSVLLLHHAGKGGSQRGTSNREDVLDESISLVRPSDYDPNEGARFEVHYKKGRGLFGEDADPFEARLEVRDGKAAWTTRNLKEINVARVRDLLAEKLSLREIAEILDISRSQVHRIKSQLTAEGGTGGEE